jgi:hypothetical protein
MASKKQQKAGFPLPDPVTGYDLIDVCLKIPDAPEYRRAFLGHINQLGQWFMWEKSYLPGDTRAKEAGELWRRVLFDHLHMGDDCMSGCCDDPPALYRYNADGTLERSTDGGETWTAAPGFDPRFNSPQFPPVSGDDGDDKRCLTATGAALLMKEQVADQLTDDMARYTLSQLINDWLKTVTQDGGNILDGLVTIIANQSFAVGVAALRAALTDTVWDTVKCILYCHIKDDASFDEAGWQAVKSDIASQIGGIASLFLQQLVNVLGPVGLTNLARSGGATSGDCSACDCPDDPHVFVWDELAAESTQIFPDGDGIYTAPSGTATSGGYYVCTVYFHEALPIPAHWNCWQIDILSSPPISDFFKYRCSDYTLDALTTCPAQYTWRSNSAPFSIQFSIGDHCGAE